MSVPISIVTATLNSVSTLDDCLKSLKNQTLSFEHIVVDGKSTDGTLELLKEYGSQITCLISESDNGIYDAMNKGIRSTSGDVIGILNADDYYADSRVLEKIAGVFEDKRIDSCYGDLDYVHRQNTSRIVRRWRAGEFQKIRFYYGWMPPHPTFFVRRWVYERFGNFNLKLGSAADYELMLRFLLKNNITSVYIPEALVKMRVGGRSNASIKNRLIANRHDRIAWKINGLKPYPWTLTLKPLRKIGQYLVK